jgi:hypothetical protein
MLLKLRRRIKGRPGALARLLVICICLIAAGILAQVLHAPASVIVGSFFGAALSLLVGWLVSELETEEETTKIPSQFYEAAKAEIASIGYYRDTQSIKLTLRKDQNSGSEILELQFTAKLIPAHLTKVWRPNITPPEGTEFFTTPSYKVNDTRISEGDHKEIDKPCTDELVVKYKITDPVRPSICDEHTWPSPVLQYEISFEVDGSFPLSQFDFAVKKKAYRAQQESLDDGHKTQGRLTFEGKGAAFTGQRLRWELTRVRGPLQGI